MNQRGNKIEQSQKILDLASKLEVPSTKKGAEVWPIISSKLTSRSKLIKLSGWMKIAASISLVYITTYLLYQTHNVTVITSKAQQKEVVLPDRSKVLLNAESKLHYNKLTWALDRSLTFEGEGYFEVVEGSAFTVNSTNGTTRVLGTSFNIYARAGNYEVSCSSGRVQVDIPNRSQRVLDPGLSTSNSDESTNPIPFEKSRVLGWKKGEFYFESQPLADVLATVERQYDVKIISQQTDLKRRYTGFFTNKDIDETLKVVCLPMGLNYELLDAKNIKIYKTKMFN
ncbi:MAG: FecR domain-containing protein [Bacteroidota bacterium]